MSGENAIVFVVDDDPSVREALESLLRSVGLGVRTFASAQDFLSNERPSVPSCLVLDVHLPGLSGFDLQQELAKTGVQISIIFITGRGDIPMSVRAVKAGALEFLPKPFDNEENCSMRSNRESVRVQTAGQKSRALKSLCCTVDSKHRPALFSVARCYINALLSSRLIPFNLDRLMSLR